MEFDQLSRRRFLSTAAGAAALLAMSRKGVAFGQDAVLDIPRSNNHIGYEKVVWKVEPFPMTQVRLRNGVFKNAMDIDAEYLASLPNDRLLHMFRVTAGLPSTVEPLGGWEAPDCELRGHFAGGHYLSACALMYSSTENEALRSKANDLVTELIKCQAPNGYLGAYPESFYDRLKAHEHVWAPFYTYHKIMAGMLDMYVHGGNEQALASCERMADWADAWSSPIPADEFQRILRVEFGGMSEVSYNLYAVTGKQKYMTLGERFSKKAFFDPLAAREDHLAGLHANTHIPQAISAARGYELTKDDRDHTIADYFFHEVVAEHAYATGGTSDGEGWQAAGQLSHHLGPAAEECCCSYNMMKLGRHVYGWTIDPRVMDYYERLLFNVRLGTQDKDGMLMYYVSLKPGGWKTFGTPTDAFWCCTGTGVEEYAKTNDSIYFHDKHNLYVNLFIGSEVKWPEKKLSVIQDTNFPEEQGTTLTVQAERPTSMTMHIRIPYWATEGVIIKVNGKAKKVAATPSSYVALRRRWKQGDKVEVSLPMQMHTSPTPDDGTIQAPMYGPLVLAARLGREGLTHDDIYGPNAPEMRDETPIAMPEATVEDIHSVNWVAPVAGEKLRFHTVGQTKETELIPLYQLMDERYSVYWKVTQKSV